MWHRLTRGPVFLSDSDHHKKQAEELYERALLQAACLPHNTLTILHILLASARYMNDVLGGPSKPSSSLNIAFSEARSCFSASSEMSELTDEDKENLRTLQLIECEWFKKNQLLSGYCYEFTR